MEESRSCDFEGNIENTTKEEEERLETLRLSRFERVYNEPDLAEPHIMVSVRHTIVGNKVRFFKDQALMSEVYDWVGSLCRIPEHFMLLDYSGKPMLPHHIATSGMYNLREEDSAVNMSAEGTVAFSGYGVTSTDDTSDYTSKEIDPYDKYWSLKKIQDDERNNLQGSKEFYVNRDNIYADMIKLYSSRGITKLIPYILFNNENAVGDGVTRDAYSLFFAKWYEQFEGDTECVPLPNCNIEHLQIIGKIITHAFVCYNVFPIKLCKSSLKHALFSSVSNDELLKSYFNYLPFRESNKILEFSRGTNVHQYQPIVDILSEHKIFTKPNPANIMQLCITAANVCLIRLPMFAMQTLSKNMGSFWSKLSESMFDSIYQCTVPTTESVIESINAVETQQYDQQITTWLHRFLRSSNEEEIFLFLRFITGSTTLLPGDIIKVQYIDQPEDFLRPTAATCFKILYLPRQYHSFTSL